MAYICNVNTFGLDFVEWLHLSWWQKIVYRWRQYWSVRGKCGARYAWCNYEIDRARRDWLGKSLVGEEYDCVCGCMGEKKRCHCHCENGELRKWKEKEMECKENCSDERDKL